MSDMNTTFSKDEVAVLVMSLTSTHDDIVDKMYDQGLSEENKAALQAELASVNDLLNKLMNAPFSKDSISEDSISEDSS
jgi:hypothetical protein